MCYSAMVESNLRSFWRQYQGVLSYATVQEIFQKRLTDSSIRIPKAFEANFDSPTSPNDTEIKRLIDQYRAASLTKLEIELFAQKKRHADAERALKSKVTKKAQEDFRISGNKIETALDRINGIKRPELRPTDSRIFPFWYAPILIHENGRAVVKLARYHLRQPRQPESVDRKYPGLYNARRDNIEKFWRNEFGVSHALMIVDSFYENVERDGKNAVLHFVPKPAEPMLVACLYGVWNAGKEDELLSFAAITDEPPPEVAAAGHDRCIINLKPENVEKWLTPQGRSSAELQAILEDKQRPYYEHKLLAA